jgi:hypothetical protein
MHSEFKVSAMVSLATEPAAKRPGKNSLALVENLVYMVGLSSFSPDAEDRRRDY